MAKFSIEVDEHRITRVKVDDEVIGLIQGIRFETNSSGEMELEVTFPDTNEGWAYAEKVQKIPDAKTNIVKLAEVGQ